MYCCRDLVSNTLAFSPRASRSTSDKVVVVLVVVVVVVGGGQGSKSVLKHLSHQNKSLHDINRYLWATSQGRPGSGSAQA